MTEMEGIPAMRSIASRLATFHEEHQIAKRRVSSQKKKPQATATWPHATPTPTDLARAGFFYDPLTGSDDNVKCFQCQVKLDGWEAGDNAIAEHLAHSAGCAWATCISVGTDDEERDPMEESMTDSRTATYGDLWPHDSKKGWKCKTKKMVESGWCFDPSPDADDGVTCFYCNLSLDGWEPKDNPLDEHRRRSPECLFFTLVDRYAADHKKSKGKGRVSRGSKASRLSTQSIQSTFSEAPSLMSLGDAASVMDVDDSVATITSTTGKASKKTSKSKTATKGKKKAPKEPSVEPVATYPDIEQSVQESFHDAHVAATDNSVEVKPELPASSEPARKVNKAKGKGKQSTKAQQRESEDQSQLQLQHELEVATLEEPAIKAPVKKGRGVKRTSDGLEKKEELAVLVAEENAVKVKKGGKATKIKKTKTTAKESQDHTDIDTTQATATEPAPSESQLPVRKPTKGRKTKKQIEEERAQQEALQRADTTPVKDADDSDANFVVLGATPDPEEFEPTPTPQKSSMPRSVRKASPTPVAESVHSRPQSVGSRRSSDAENHPPSSAVQTSHSKLDAQESVAAPGQSLGQAVQKTFMSPTKISRVPLAASTPNRSPSKRSPQKIGQLKSNVPWTATDLELAFVPSPEKGQENAIGVQQKLLDIGGALTSPEKQMSVEAWVRWRADRGEERLRKECENMVSLFEREGSRALTVLAGIEVQGN